MPDQTAEPQSAVIEQFSKILFLLLKQEQQLSKTFAKLEKAAFTAELAKALTPELSDQLQHIERLKLIASSLKLKKINIDVGMEHFPLLKLSSKKSSTQDLAIISNALQLQNLKLAHYEFLYSIAKASSMETESILFEQTITDNRNTNTWLRQIIQNIIAPELLHRS